MAKQLFSVEKCWGFSRTAVANADFYRGAPVKIGTDGVVAIADDTTDKNEVYLIDKVRTEALLPNETLESKESVTGTVLCRPLLEGIYTLPARHFASKPSLNDRLEISPEGLFRTAVSGVSVAVAIAVEGGTTDYTVTIKPYY